MSRNSAALHFGSSGRGLAGGFRHDGTGLVQQNRSRNFGYRRVGGAAQMPPPPSASLRAAGALRQPAPRYLQLSV